MSGGDWSNPETRENWRRYCEEHAIPPDPKHPEYFPALKRELGIEPVDEHTEWRQLNMGLPNAE